MERAKRFENEGQTLSAIETAVRLPANLDAGVHRGIGVVHVHATYTTSPNLAVLAFVSELNFQ